MPASIDTQPITLIAGVLDNTGCIGEVTREGIIAFFGTTADRRVVFLCPTHLVDSVLPVGSGYFVLIAVFIFADTRVEEIFRRRVIGTLRIDVSGTDIWVFPLSSIRVLLGVSFVESAVLCRFILIEGIMVCVKHVHLTSDLLERTFDAYFHFRFTFFTFLSGDDNYTIGTT